MALEVGGVKAVLSHPYGNQYYESWKDCIKAVLRKLMTCGRKNHQNCCSLRGTRQLKVSAEATDVISPQES